MVGLKRAVAAWTLASFFLLLSAAVLARPPFVDKIWGGVVGYGMPNYFSGTNSRVYMTVGTTPGGIKRVEFRIGGELVWEADYPNPALPPYVVTAATQKAVMFDSTHFANGADLIVEVKVWGWTAPYRAFSQSSPTKNKLMLFEDPADPTPDPVPTVANLMSGKNYYLASDDSSTWSSANYKGFMYGSNAIFFAGHGSETSHSTPAAPYGMTSSQYEAERQIINGMGLPPFNSTIYPHVNFCHLVACKCGTTDAFVKALYPYCMAWSSSLYLENQAMMGYTCYTSTDDRAENAELIWQKLSVGWTAYYTREWVRLVWLPDHSQEIQMFDVYPGPSRNMQVGDLALYAGYDNGAMRLKTVYTGTNALPSGWFREL